MRNILICLSAFFITSLSCVLYAEGKEIKDNLTGESFPSQVTFEQNGTKYSLEATGVATRKKFFVKVYSIVSYLQDYKSGQNTDVVAEIMQDDKAKQLTIRWVRNITLKQLQDGYFESFTNSLDGSVYRALQNDINSFTLMFNTDVRKGDEHILRWLPGGHIEVLINGRNAGQITNIPFAKALWGIWFGSKSVVDRNSLVGK